MLKYYILTLLFFYAIQFASAQDSNENKFVVVIDAGHGGRDNGASVGTILEKYITLAVALKTQKWIEENIKNVKVIMTRDHDVFLPLSYRAYVANKHNADLFISLHANIYQSSKVSGSETYIMGIHSNEENLKVAQKENGVILLEEDYQQTYEGFDPTSAESYIMFELIQNNFLEQSIEFATNIQNNLDLGETKSRGVKAAGFLVLKRTAMPSVLIELGYLSNQKDRNYLISEKGQIKLAESIGRSFKQYLIHRNLKTGGH